MTKIILDLCGGTGSWSEPYTHFAEYKVIVVDPMLWNNETNPLATHIRQDIRKVVYDSDMVNNIYGILCAPPCTVFANSGARWPRSEEEILEGLSVMDACLRFITICKPKFWALENPIGKMKQYLGPPKLMFNPCDYGDPYTKKTCLWGDFNIPTKNPVEPTEGSKMYLRYGGKSAKTKKERSKTPQGFAYAFFYANR